MMAGSKKVFATLGSSNHVPEEREAFDYYATDPKAVEMLLELEQFAPVIWEPACGEGHISKVLQAHGYQVISTDLVYRGFGDPEPLDFLKETLDGFEGDIITNPPYSTGLEFVQRALESVRPGGKVAMFLKVQFLEGQKRGAFFKNTPPAQAGARLRDGHRPDVRPPAAHRHGEALVERRRPRLERDAVARHAVRSRLHASNPLQAAFPPSIL